MTDSTVSRKLSLHERFSVTRANLGYCHTITVLVAFPTPSALPSEAALSQRIVELQQHFPLLYSAVQARKTREPYFEQRPAPWNAEDVIYKSTYASSGDESPIKVLEEENKRTSAIDLDASPLWQVGLFTAESSPESSPAYLVLSVNHILSDGKGSFMLLDALLASDISSLPYEKLEAIVRLEDSIDIMPKPAFLAGMIWSELVVPRLPSFLQHYVRNAPAWPAQTFLKPAFDCEGAYAMIDLPFDLIASLREAGKANGVKTLHPILQFSFATALWAVKQDALDPFVMDLQTPGSVRDPKLGHGHCTGNYVSSITVPFTPTATTSFWVATAKAGAYMSSAAGKSRALEWMGTLAYVPDPVPDPAKAETNQPTGWEEFFFKKAYSQNRFGASVGVSNIGKVELPPNAVDLIWAQSPYPLAPVFELNIVGHAAGLKVTAVWREGAVVTKSDLDLVVTVWKRILLRLANPENTRTTLEELAQE